MLAEFHAHKFAGDHFVMMFLELNNPVEIKMPRRQRHCVVNAANDKGSALSATCVTRSTAGVDLVYLFCKYEQASSSSF